MSGNSRPQSPQLAEPLWTDPGIKSGIGACELIKTSKQKTKKKKKKKERKKKRSSRRMNGRTFSKYPCMREKAAIFYNRLHVLSERGVLYHMDSLFKHTVCRRTLQAPATLPEYLSNLVTGFQHGLSSLSRHSCWLPILSEFS